MGNTLKGGSRSSPGDSLAAMIETEIDVVRGQYDLEPLTAENKEDLRPLLLGIARGIVRYIGDNPEAFTVSISGTDIGGGLGSHGHTGTVSAISTDPT